MATNSHYCLICGQIPGDRQNGISYHKIGLGRENEWLGFFGITVESLKSKIEYALFCNRHFLPTDFNYVGKTKKRVLKKYSTPSIRYIDEEKLRARKIRLTKLDNSNECKQSSVQLDFLNTLRSGTMKKSRKNRGIICIYCQDQTGSALSFFNFPKDHRRMLWISACDLENPIPENARLCSIHFEMQHFAKMPGNDGRAVLEKTAIPTLFMKNSNKNVNPKLFTGTVSSEIPNETNKNVVVMDGTIDTNGDYNSELFDTANSANKTIETQSRNEELGVQYFPKASTPCTSRSSKKLYSALLDHSSSENSPSLKMKKPLYAGDIDSWHMKNPKIARHSYKITLSTIQQQKNKIDLLQKQLKRRNKKVQNLFQVLEKMRKNNMLSGNATD